MKVKVKVIGDYAVADENGKLITKPGILELVEDEALRLEVRKVVEIVGSVEQRAGNEEQKRPAAGENVPPPAADAEKRGAEGDAAQKHKDEKPKRAKP